jgi:hypothetical protein
MSKREPTLNADQVRRLVVPAFDALMREPAQLPSRKLRVSAVLRARFVKALQGRAP